jgi:hypothetical protein
MAKTMYKIIKTGKSIQKNPLRNTKGVSNKKAFQKTDPVFSHNPGV